MRGDACYIFQWWRLTNPYKEAPESRVITAPGGMAWLLPFPMKNNLFFLCWNVILNVMRLCIIVKCFTSTNRLIFESAFLQHGCRCEDIWKSNALICWLLWVIFNINVSGIKWDETGVHKFKFVINYGCARIQLYINWMMPTTLNWNDIILAIELRGRLQSEQPVWHVHVAILFVLQLHCCLTLDILV